jgi:dsDNA-binding SOS-regulon protein
MEPLQKLLSAVGSVGVLCTTLYGGATWVDDRFARAPRVELLELRFEEKVMTDRAVAIQDRIWEIEDRYDDFLNVAPVSVKEEHRQMIADLAKVREEIRAVMDGYHRKNYPASDDYYKYENSKRSR